MVDASFVVAALVDSGPVGTWADRTLESDDLAAPHLMPVEAANILRRAAQSGQITGDAASLVHADLLALSVVYFSYEPFGTRVWELRDNVTCYDAWYVALAEYLDTSMATLDRKLTKASGVRCSFLTPPKED
ncbi:type II toxin-antitoxin system VapC family toxin [Phytoactinopolyspora halophila]|uniref:type II toxin-antitoxin system VapC family toxin n=1 Tax=Phytoactinopolyspora halophila TaxID=1981511 RepID=UPI001B8BE907|nr:type II toxin-antitoxin system VapC family toxin [Phytoactinopolyspora halophila]